MSYTEKLPIFNHQQTEVQEILEVPLSVIQDLPKPPLTMELPRTNGYKVPYFDFQNHKIWGATSMILSELNELLKMFKFGNHILMFNSLSKNFKPQSHKRKALKISLSKEEKYCLIFFIFRNFKTNIAFLSLFRLKN